MKRDDDALDRRSFAELVDEATALIRRSCPDWTDLSPGDPGMTLIEVYAWLTETMLYRLNRLPARLHVELLKLLGVAPLPPAAAQVRLQISRAPDMPPTPLSLPAGLQVSDAGGTVVFSTIAPVTLAEGEAMAEVTAIHADQVAAELIGHGNGDGGQTFTLRRAPVLRPLGGTEVVRIGVETASGQPVGEASTVTTDGRIFVLWSEVAGFSARQGAQVYVLDRVTGRVTFGPGFGAARAAGATRVAGATLAAVPPEGAQIRAWYLTGGGRSGNVAAGALTCLRKPLPGILVRNPDRATGGEDPETQAAFLSRARGDIRTLDCAVTASDFEQVALNAGGVARAAAAAQRDLWVFGTPGLVEVLAVPSVQADAATGAVTADDIAAHCTPLLRQRIAGALDAHRPIGVRTDVRWGRCLAVGVSGRVAIAPSEDAATVQARIIRRLNRLLQPASGWRFGRGLRASDVYETILEEPGVRYAERIVLTAAEGAEGPVAVLAGDPHQPRCIYALLTDGLYRSLDNAASWERVLDSGDYPPTAIATDPETPGFLALIGRAADQRSRLWTSRDCGESWTAQELIEHPVSDLAMVRRDNRHWILLATDKGIFRTDRDGARGLQPVAAGADATHQGYYAAASGTTAAGQQFAAVAARQKGGVWLSSESGFRLLPGSQGRDIRRLRFHRSGGQLWLWAAMLAEAGAAGQGLMRIGIRDDGLDPAGWEDIGRGWRGGSCLDFDLDGPRVAAATRDGGILVIDDLMRDPVWRAPTLSSGLPIDDTRERLLPLRAVAIGRGGEQRLIAGGPRGLFAGDAAGLNFLPAGGRRFADQVPLPARWLFCAGDHDIQVFSDLQDRMPPDAE